MEKERSKLAQTHNQKIMEVQSTQKKEIESKKD